jgi:hypothetical protein
LFFFAIFFKGSLITFAQNNNQINTQILKNKNDGLFGALSFSYTKINSRGAFVNGARAGYIFNHNIAVGIASYSFLTDFNYHHIIDFNPIDLNLAGGYVGFFIEPILQPKLPIHLSFPLFAGIGGVALIEKSNSHRYNIFNKHFNNHYLVFEPAVEIEFNLTKHLRTSFTTSYRFTSKINMVDTNPNILEGVSLGLTIKLGKF